MNADDLETEELWSRPGLRIALVTETYPPEINGVARTLGCMVEGLIARGHRVQLIRPRQSSTDTPHASSLLDEVLSRGLKLPRYDGLHFGLPARTRLQKLWQRQRPDLVHVATEGPLGWSAVSAARKLRIPVTSDFHTNFDHYSRHYGVGWLRKPVAAYLRSFHNRTALTLVPTEAMARDLQAQGYGKVGVVARGVDTVLFDPVRRDQGLRDVWGLGADGVVVLHVGRLAAEKNLPLVVRAFRAIEKRCPGARLVFVGDGPMRESLMRDIPDAHFAGMRTGTDLARHYASADVFLFPSLTETFGNVTLEAIASGLAVVAFDYAAAADVLHDGKNGLLARFGDEQAFVDAAASLFDAPEVLGQIRLDARQTALSMSWDEVNERFANALHDVWRDSGHADQALRRSPEMRP